MTSARRVITALAVAFALSLTSCSNGDDRANPFSEKEHEQLIVLYDQYGKEVQRWDGLISMQTSKAGCVAFSIEGKRTILYGGIVVIQDKEGGDE